MNIRKTARAMLLVAMVAGAAGAAETPLADFDGDDYGRWSVKGEAFGRRPAAGALPGQSEVIGHKGAGLVNSFHGRDGGTGTLTSPEFPLAEPYITFLIGGGKHPVETGMELLVGGERVRRATGADSEVLQWKSWDVRDLRGQTARLRIYDLTGARWGHVLVDHILLSDTPRSGYDQTELEAYRQSPEYYRERYRPQYHFTPERNWTNDPNGLVYFDGEYHLFYQHNPWGNVWGHMSWGHAVSGDMVHWTHLPVAIYEDGDIMAFSGCCVVDHRNTSGFGGEGETPMVAIYTGHGRGEQVQNIAYSLDRGRTWQPYEHNPVLDLNSTDFRDPKVFWHEPTRRWVMVVSLAAQKRLLLYGSPDLKAWELLSEFGPAGLRNKPNWECPDLFELSIEDEPGQTRWVLEADVGSGGIAGGSGGEYFVGTFDGERFTPEESTDEVRWVDYGRDFYAPVSYSDIPDSDGRRLWIGWMNNWESSLVPTHPWRGTMSIPRSLSLRRTGDELRLIQRPVAELQRLRDRHRHLQGVTLTDETRPLEISGQQLEIIAELDKGTADTCGLRVLVGEGEETVVGYDATDGQLFVDRRRSGDVGFHKNFAGRHAGTLSAPAGRVALHVYVDACTVEVFGNDGQTVISDLVFPDSGSQAVQLFATRGTARVESLDVWTLKSIWHQDRRSGE